MPPSNQPPCRAARLPPSLLLLLLVLLLSAGARACRAPGASVSWPARAAAAQRGVHLTLALRDARLGQAGLARTRVCALRGAYADVARQPCPGAAALGAPAAGIPP